MLVIADTIVRTVELGVTITDAALVGETTVVFCDLVDRGRSAARADDVPLRCARAAAIRVVVEFIDYL